MFKNTKTDTSGSNAVASQKGCAKFKQYLSIQKLKKLKGSISKFSAIDHNEIQTVQIAKFTLFLFFYTFFPQHWIEIGAGKIVHSGIHQKNALHRR
jgi:hypothetical protein